LSFHCPHCGKSIATPTRAQIEAYNLVHIRGFSQEEAAEFLGVTQQAISKNLVALQAIRPDLFETREGFMKLDGMSDIQQIDETKIVHRW